jgi:hypothetical protein
MTAGGVEPRNSDAVAFFNNGNARSNSGDQAHGFVTWNERKCRLEGPISVRRVEIGVANATRLGLHHNLSNSWRGDVPLAKHKRLSEALHDCSVHLFLCHEVPLFKSRIRCVETPAI